MAAEGYALSNGPSQKAYRMPSSQAISPVSQSNNPFDADMSVSGFPIGVERASGRPESEVAAIHIRNIPRHTTAEALRTMLLFTKDFISADFVDSDSPSNHGYLSAIARFRSNGAAEEAKSLLNGKKNNPNEPTLQVDIYRLSPSGNLGPGRNNYDMASNRAYSSSSTASSSGQPRSSRFNGTFQAIDRLSPPNAVPGITNGSSYSAERSDVVSPLSNFFSPQSPIGQPMSDRQRVSGKSVIGEDSIDDEPGDLLKDPLSYAKSDMSGQLSRLPTNPQLPTSRFASLSLSTTTATSPPMSGFTSPRSAAPMQSPTTTMSPNGMINLGPNASYQLANPHYQRHNYPPVNPADQNPPCNTLYVGNLPIDTSEDELKTMFAKQRGYKRLCFRTKANGPMCFVEFEDISFATKALNELYGHPLHNSVKGGIRLSFSKNPLGVRNGQPGGLGAQTPMSPSGPMLGANGLGIQPFSTANGPPPGLAAPPGLHSSGSGMNGMMSPTSVSSFGMTDSMGMPVRSPYAGGMANGWGGQGGQYSASMFGR